MSATSAASAQRPAPAKGGAARKTAPAASSDIQKKLHRLGLVEPDDFVLHLPIRYEDETHVTPIARLQPGTPALVQGDITHAEISYRPRRHLTAKLVDETGELQLRWLNFYPSQHKQLIAGKPLRAHGEVRGGIFGREMIHPRMTAADRPLSDALTPVYPTTDGLAQPALRRAILQALAQADLRDTLPEDVRQRAGVIAFEPAVRALHAPSPAVSTATLIDRTHPAWIRIKFDELLAQQLSLAAARAARLEKIAGPLARRRNKASLFNRLLAALPFSLTQAQVRVVDEIGDDLQRAHPMHRLLQGDVGSGKTVVAALAAAQAIDAGAQVALMAPTEILAEQHVVKLRSWLEPLGVTVAWLSGSLAARAKRETVARAESGEIQLLVGTQALIQDHVVFPALGLVIVDEQHRFGVGQRLALSRKGERQSKVPHQLNMSATPIPRTLAMTVFADLDVSVIDALPPGRTPVVTKLLADTRRTEVLQRIGQAARKGQQVYWVCPLVEESEAIELQNAVDTFERMRAELPDLSVGLVHGRLTPAEKAQVMTAFRDGQVQVLVATTVIEVGVDVPNASLMVIEHAERFGLAQLHQLRGRVGRGAAESVCVLLYQAPLSHVARDRLRAMFETTDGFEIARRDLAQRGPGEFLGKRQSGMALLRFADLEQDAALAEHARELAAWLRAHHPDIAAAHLQRWMRGREDFLRT